MKKLGITLLLVVFATIIYAQSWTLTSNVPGGTRQGAVSFVINGKIYIGGGQDSLIKMKNDFFEYDPATNSWAQKANLPDYIGGSGCFAFNSKGYVVGGQNRSSNTKSVFEYDPVLDKWTTLSSFPGTARQHPVAFVIADTGYIFGGYTGQEVNDLWAFNSTNKTWSQKASMPSVGRGSAAGFVVGNIAYVGLGEYNSSANYPSDMGAYNPVTNTWSTIAQFPGHLRAGPLSYSIGNYGYVGFGGYSSGGQYYRTNDIWQYNPKTNSWLSAGSFPGQARGNAVCERVGDIVYVGTGLNETNYPTDWWRFIYRVVIDMPSELTVCGNSKVILDPVVEGGILPISYSWKSVGDSLSCYTCAHPAVTITQNSSYILTVLDANNTAQSDTISYLVSANTNTLQLETTNTHISCDNPVDTTTLVVTGGVAPFAIKWGDGSGVTDISPVIHTYSQGGTFVISVTDTAGCVTSVFDTILNSSVAVSLLRNVPPICLGDSSGRIVVKVSGGTPPYTYKWTNGGTIDSINNIMAGSYALTVTDTNACSAVFIYNLNPANDVWDYYVYMRPNAPNCADNGSITATPYGGLTPFKYVWNNGDSTQTIKGLAAGDYRVTVTDSSGCPRKAFTKLDFHCESMITGSVFVDKNTNCVFDSTDIPEMYTTVIASANGEFYYGFTDWHGNYKITVPDTGTYRLYTYNWDWDEFCSTFTLCGNSSQLITISSLGDSSQNNNFASTTSSGFDLTLHPGWTTANPGFQKEYWLLPFNQSFTPFNGPATITFAYDSNLIYSYSLDPLPVHDPIAHTLTWTLNDLPYPFYDWSNFRLENFFRVPVTLELGYLLQSDFYITPTSGDCDSSNNYLHISETVRGSHDPNEKSVEPAKYISPTDSMFTYTIHFQNTGTDSTWFIVIKDTLSPYLDPSSVRNIASSHPYSEFSIGGKGDAGILTWTFNPLRLVDSITNPAGSQGFVSFTVKKKKGLPIGTTISNTAYIYFDYYDAVVTNTVTDTVAIIFTSVNSLPETEEVTIKAYPNPFNSNTTLEVTGVKAKYDFELYDVTGRLKRKITGIESSRFQLQRSELSAGVYFYRITALNGQAAYGKLVAQ